MSELSNQLLDLLISTGDICVALEQQVQTLAKIRTPMELTTAFCYALHHIQHECGMPTEEMIADVATVLMALTLICPINGQDEEE